jgi:hypothetical protein
MKNTVKKHGNADAYRVFLRSLAQKERFLSGLSLWSTALGAFFIDNICPIWHTDFAKVLPRFKKGGILR